MPKQFPEYFHPIYDKFIAHRGNFIETTEDRMKKALISGSTKKFISTGLGYGLLAGASLWFFAILTTFFLYYIGIITNTSFTEFPVPNETVFHIIEMLRIPALIFASGLVFGVIGFTITFFGYIYYPKMTANARKREINMLLPDAISYMYALSLGGLNQLEIFYAVANAEDTYGEVSREFQIILKETQYFQEDYKSALQNHSQITPSDKMSVFLSDMLSILSSGGDLESFLSEKKRMFMRASKQEQEETLETLELFGEMYMVLSMFPLLLIIVMMTMALMGETDTLLLYGIVYVLIPMIGIGFLIMVSTVKQDEVGSGTLEGGENIEIGHLESDLSAGELAGEYADDTGFEMFEDIEQREGLKQIISILTNPSRFFRRNPSYTLFFTVPLAIVFMTLMLYFGMAPTSMDAFIEGAVWGSLVYFYIPAYLVGFPLMIFHEWSQRYRYSVVSRLSETLRKLANANDTGLTLLESVENVSENSRGRLSDEFRIIHQKVKFGMTVKQAFIEFNNKYQIPRLARTTRLIVKAQETSDEITDVLKTAAEASENQDDINRERKSRARMQVAIILMTYLTLLGVMVILQTQFVDVMAELATSAGGGGGGGEDSPGGGQFNIDLNVNELSMLFFHAVTLQALMSGLISGYIRSAELISGLKYSLVLLTISVVTWGVIT